ncbi:MAG TPA: hypothetical protein PLQ76_00785, partial [bacterium]|nr:hypothetical protein [bacterium]
AATRKRISTKKPASSSDINAFDTNKFGEWLQTNFKSYTDSPFKGKNSNIPAVILEGVGQD